MAERPVLVLTRLDDPTSDAVITELGRRGVPVMRLDPGDFMTGGVHLAARYGPEGMSGIVRTSSREVRLEQVRSVYLRRPSDYVVPEGLDGQDARFALAQARHGLGGVLGALDSRSCRYVNHPWNVMRHDHKPAQWAAAARHGFHVPATLVTNSVEEARTFASAHGPIVYKPLRITPFRGQDGHAVTLWVEVVDPSELDERIAVTAHVFQTATPGKVADLRITVIGDHAFGVRIDSPHLDFRRDYQQVQYSIWDVPAKLADSCRTYMAEFGLLFGAFDFGLRGDGSFDFYECNSAGQWHWLQAETGLPMTAALADLLEKP
ncbi:ATP-grasp ribosomal peptide maturase [Actinomadura litoris]|uniref:ATP-grasp ribosomal peptide maturase n=1 Tax=Actinomadura litoris TaxID=2678616 RepID=UPI001FA734B9|nr:ATP-grasp ribosomal peptide maturase [Actinomadura litoris]